MDAMYFAMSGPELDDDAPPANAPPDADADDSADADAEAEPNAQDAGIGKEEGGKGARVRKFSPSNTYFFIYRSFNLEVLSLVITFFFCPSFFSFGAPIFVIICGLL